MFGGKVLAPVDCVECLFKPFATQPMEEVHNQYNVDGASQYLPYSWAMQQSWQSDGYMGWNPYTHNGTSLPENTMLSPGDWHHWLFGFLPFWTAWDAGILLQFFIAGLGMIILLKSRGIPIPYVLLGAVSFSFYSQFIMWIYDRWLGGIIWAPLIVWSLLEGRRKTNGCIFPLFSLLLSDSEEAICKRVSLFFFWCCACFLRIGGNGQTAGPGKFF